MIDIFELLDKDLDLQQEYDRMYEMFFYEPFHNYSLAYYFNEKLYDWDYRGTCSSGEEVLQKLNINSVVNDLNAFDEILKLMQFILNIKLFLDNKGLENDSFVLYKNIFYILNKINYEYKIENDRVYLYPKDEEVFMAIDNVNKDMKSLLFEYIKFDIKNDVTSKSRLLSEIAKKMEPLRKEYSTTNKTLTEKIFQLFNKLDIRHNNKAGSKKNEIVANMTEEELIGWYDKLYKLIIYLINQKENNSLLREVEEFIRKIEES